MIGIKYEYKVDFRPVERAVDKVSGELKGLKQNSPIAKAVRRQVRKQETMRRRKEQEI